MVEGLRRIWIYFLCDCYVLLEVVGFCFLLIIEIDV